MLPQSTTYQCCSGKLTIVPADNMHVGEDKILNEFSNCCDPGNVQLNESDVEFFIRLLWTPPRIN